MFTHVDISVSKDHLLELKLTFCFFSGHSDNFQILNNTTWKIPPSYFFRFVIWPHDILMWRWVEMSHVWRTQWDLVSVSGIKFTSLIYEPGDDARSEEM